MVPCPDADAACAAIADTDSDFDIILAEVSAVQALPSLRPSLLERILCLPGRVAFVADNSSLVGAAVRAVKTESWSSLRLHLCHHVGLGATLTGHAQSCSRSEQYQVY